MAVQRIYAYHSGDIAKIVSFPLGEQGKENRPRESRSWFLFFIR